MVASSFAPFRGAIKKCSVYMSDFGKEKMAEEKVKGPQIEGVDLDAEGFGEDEDGVLDGGK